MDLDGRTYVSTAGSRVRLVPGTQVWLAFADGRISARAGCNTVFGGYAVRVGRLVVDGPLASTLMACSPELSAQDEWLAGFLASGPAVALDGDVLRLSDEEVVLVLVPERTPPLVGTHWQLDAIVTRGAASSLPAGTAAGLTVDADAGRIGLSTGCNTGTAPVVVAGTAVRGVLSLGRMTVTRRRCGEDAMAVERHILAVLAGEVTYEVDGPRLRLTRDLDGLVLTAAPAQ